MKRSHPPQRKTPLKRGKRPKQIGKKALREQEARIEFARAVARNAGGYCETMHLPVVVATMICTVPVVHAGAHAHHVWPEDRDRGVHDPNRGLWLCARAHDWSHTHPALAWEYGLLRSDALRRTNPAVE